MLKPELVIFDCDGVLVDSEWLASKIEARLLSDAGLEITAEEIGERYSGLTWKEILLDVEKNSDILLSASMIDQAEKLVDMALERELDMIEGADRAVKRIKLPKCIASNSSRARLGISLGKTGLEKLFDPHIFAAHEVGNNKGKPDPNVFLHAASVFKARPSNTIVVEDSVHGIKGAVAAGMRVIGFTGGKHTYPGHGDRLTEAGAETVINRHALLPDMIAAMGEWRDI